MPRTKVLLICMVDSIHFARWISQFTEKEIDFFLFPSGPNRRIHPRISILLSAQREGPATFKIIPWRGRFSIFLWFVDRLLDERLRGWLLGRAIKEIKPDFLHALEFQHAGYIAERSLRDETLKVPFTATNFGSDIFWFQRFPSHLKKSD